jgi:hypothetical protein
MLIVARAPGGVASHESGKLTRIALAGLVVRAGGVGRELGEVLQQVGWSADAVLGAQVGCSRSPTAAWNPAPVASMIAVAVSVSSTSSVSVTR